MSTTYAPLSMDSAASVTLSYPPLPPVASIGRTPPYTRILTLHPGPHQAPLSCTLELLDIENPQYRFEALSYVWGKEWCPTSLLFHGINGHLRITFNLDQALRALRHPSFPRRLWVDAVCIDQGNFEERARQVRYMRLVYKSAARTIIWFGPETPNTTTVFALIKEMCELIGGNLDTFELAPRYQSNPGSLTPHELGILEIMSGIFQFRTEDMQALERFFASPYFQRVWCLQEVVASTVCVAQSGRLELDFNHFLALMPWVYGFSTAPVPTRTLRIWKHIKKKKLRSCHTTKQSQLEGSIGNMLFLLQDIRNFQSTDPRDRIFALMGISQEGIEPVPIKRPTGVRSILDLKMHVLLGVIDGLETLMPELEPGRNPALQINYTKSTRDTYRDFTRHFMRRHPRLLNVLSHVQHHSNPTSGWPSWVPKFDEPSVSSFLNPELFVAGLPEELPHGYYAEVHDNPLRPQSIFRRHVQQPDLLQLNGFRVDEIEAVSDIVTEELEIETLPDTIWKQLFHDGLNGDRHTSASYCSHHNEPFKVALLMTLICGGTATLARNATFYGRNELTGSSRTAALEQTERVGKADVLA